MSRRWLATEDDSHDDFKPQVKAGAAAGVKDTIERDVAGHDVFIYMKVCMVHAHNTCGR